MKLVRIAASPCRVRGGLEPRLRMASNGAMGDDLFSRAATEKRFVILDLEAVWCIGANVMEKTTYADPQVKDLLARNICRFASDQDANPIFVRAATAIGGGGCRRPSCSALMAPRSPRSGDISSLNGSGAAQGHNRRSLSPRPARLFEVKPSASAFLSKPPRAKLTTNVDESWDEKPRPAGARTRNSSTPTAWISRSPAPRAGDATAILRARQTLDAAVALIDPVWGGVYQIPKRAPGPIPFRKDHVVQRNICGSTARPTRCEDPKYLQPREHRALSRGFLSSPSGAFYVSQKPIWIRHRRAQILCARDSDRRKRGCRQSTRNLYARENGWRSRHSCVLQRHQRSKALAIAERAARWVRDNRALPNGGFRPVKRIAAVLPRRHLAMGQAFSISTPRQANREWLTSAAKAGDLFATFRDEAGGFVTSKTSKAKPACWQNRQADG